MKIKSKSCKPCGESSPYWDYVTNSRENFYDGTIKEPIEANPEIETETPIIKDPLLDAILEVLDEGGEQVLSKREKEVFQLLVREGLSQEKTAKKLGISRRACREHVKRIASKMRRLCSPKL